MNAIYLVTADDMAVPVLVVSKSSFDNAFATLNERFGLVWYGEEYDSLNRGQSIRIPEGVLMNACF